MTVGTLGVTFGVLWGHLVDIRDHFEGTLGVTLGILWDYFGGTFRVV